MANTKYVYTINGETKLLVLWCREHNCQLDKAKKLLNEGMKIEDVLVAAKRKRELNTRERQMR